MSAPVRAALAVAAAALVSLATSCVSAPGGGNGTSTLPPGASTSTATPVEVMANAVAVLGRETFRVSRRDVGGRQLIHEGGQVDPVNDVMKLDLLFATAESLTTTNGEIRRLGDDVYVRGLTGAAGGWMHLSMARMSVDNAVAAMLARAEAPVPGGVTEAGLGADGAMRGTGNLDPVATLDEPLRRCQQAMADELRGMGISTVEFTGSLDLNQRVTVFDYTLSSVDLGGDRAHIVISGYGETVVVEPPAAAQVHEATAADYASLDQGWFWRIT